MNNKKTNRLRVLIACKQDATPYITELFNGLQKENIDVEIGLEKFWLHSKNYDIIHLQWPEALFGWKNPSLPDLRILFSEVLPEWKKTAKIVITRHNKQAHLTESRANFQLLYEHIYKYVDGVVHLGNFEINEFKHRKHQHKFHTLIPHPIYSIYGEPINKLKARKKLNIPLRKTVILAFGLVRHIQESMLLLHAFQKLNIPKKFLLTSNFRHSVTPSRRTFFQWLVWEFKNHEILWPRKLYIGRQFIPDERVRYFFSAADTVVIPRINTINSGVLPLAYQFGKTVAGPDIGNIGLLLKATGNPTFNPASVDDCAACIEEAVRLAPNGKGLENKQYAYDNWMLEKIVAMHVKFYKNIISNVN